MKSLKRPLTFVKTQTKLMLFDLKDYADVDKLLSPFILVIPLEWFVYYLAHFNGEDIVLQDTSEK